MIILISFIGSKPSKESYIKIIAERFIIIDFLPYIINGFNEIILVKSIWLGLQSISIFIDKIVHEWITSKNEKINIIW